MKKTPVILLTCMTLVGCGRSITSTPGDAPNLETFVAEIKAQTPTEKREPLPLLLTQEVFSYSDHTTIQINPNPQSAVDRAEEADRLINSAQGALDSLPVSPNNTVHSPDPLEIAQETEQRPLRSPFDYPTTTISVGALHPDNARPKQALESYTLDSLNMVGTMGAGHSLTALVQTPDNVVYRVSPGQYMGQSDGKVVGITSTEIKLVELVADGAGGWTEQSAALLLNE